MIATRFTADQLVISAQYASTDKAVNIAKAAIKLCQMIQQAYPDARFAVDGNSRNASNEVDYRGCVDVYTSVDGPSAGHIDVDDVGTWGTDKKFTFTGPFVDKGDARYYGDGKIWRKDPLKLVEAIIAQNCLRGKNSLEQYLEARKAILASAGRRLANLEEHAGKLRRLAQDQAIMLAMGHAPSPELKTLSEAARLHWRGIIEKVQQDADAQNDELARTHNVDLRDICVTDRCTELTKVMMLV